MDRGIARIATAAAVALAGVSVAFWSFDRLPDQPTTTYGGASTVLLWLEVSTALALALAASVAAYRRRWLLAGAVWLLGLSWLAPEISGIHDLSTGSRALAALAGELVLPITALAATARKRSEQGAQPFRLIAAAVAGGLITVAALTQRDPFRDPDCWHLCTHNELATQAFADRSQLTTVVVTVLLASWGLLALAIVWSAHRALRSPRGLTRQRVDRLAEDAESAAFVVLVVALLAATILRAVMREDPDLALFKAVFVVSHVGALGIASLLVLDAVRNARLGRALTRLAVDLESMRTPALLEAALATAVNDPLLSLKFPASGANWVDAGGRPRRAAPATTGTNSTTVVRDGLPVAEIEHSEAVAAAVIESSLSPALRLSIENAGLQAASMAELAELKASRERIIERSDGERRRLERDLHDGMQQRLVGLVLLLGMLRDDIERAEPDAAGGARRASGLAAELLDQLRAIARGIFPSTLSEVGLVEAIYDLAEGHDAVQVRVDAPEGMRLPPAVEAAAYLVAAFSVENAAQRGARTVEIAAALDGDRLTLDICHDGTGGFDAADQHLADRVGALDGVLTTDFPPPSDTLVRRSLHLEVPCAR